MSLVDYTSYDDIRAAIGVSKDELKDATLSLDLYYFNLVSEMEDLSLSIMTDYLDIKVIDSSTRTAEQSRFYQSVRLFATYAVAKQLTTSLPMFSPKEQTDGKAALVRFTQDPYKATIEAVMQSYEAFKVKLESAYSAITSSDATVLTSRPYFETASPDSNPVLGT